MSCLTGDRGYSAVLYSVASAWRALTPRADRALGALCRSRKDLAGTRVQILGQLRANLELAFRRDQAVP